MEVKITRLNHSGEGIGTINKKTAFIPKTIPGDTVEAQIIKEHKNYIEALPIEYKEKSPNRTQILCPYYQECGGCQLMGLTYQDQLNYKQNKVKDILKKYANLELNPTITGTDDYHYRNKLTLQVQNGQLGLYASKTNKLVPINNCLLASPSINNLIKIINEQLTLYDITKITLRTATNQLMAIFEGKINRSTLITTIAPHVTSLYLNDEHLSGTTTITAKLAQYEFLVSPQSFFQVNYQQTINLYNKVKEHLNTKNKNVLDLYCGTGTIGIYVSQNCQKVTGIELNPSSIKDAIANANLNHVNNIKFIEGSVGKILEAKNTYDAIILDPPRSGLDKKTKATLLKIKSPKLVYISCDPITLARDLNVLKEIYNIEDLSLFDMFPNTYHIESIAFLTLK